MQNKDKKYDQLAKDYVASFGEANNNYFSLVDGFIDAPRKIGHHIIEGATVIASSALGAVFGGLAVGMLGNPVQVNSLVTASAEGLVFYLFEHFTLNTLNDDISFTPSKASGFIVVPYRTITKIKLGCFCTVKLIFHDNEKKYKIKLYVTKKHRHLENQEEQRTKLLDYLKIISNKINKVPASSERTKWEQEVIDNCRIVYDKIN